MIRLDVQDAEDAAQEKTTPTLPQRGRFTPDQCQTLMAGVIFAYASESARSIVVCEDLARVFACPDCLTTDGEILKAVVKLASALKVPVPGKALRDFKLLAALVLPESKYKGAMLSLCTALLLQWGTE